MKNLAIIPARSGSKGLKDKNIKPLNGIPLLAYSIKAAQESDMFSNIMVSTDSEHYARIAKEYGAEIPFLRSEENSSDKSGSWETVKEVLAGYAERFDTVCLLQPTSPLRTAEDIKAAYQELKEKDADAITSVCEADHSPLWTMTLDESLSMHDFRKKHVEVPRQQLEKYYRLNGALYIRRIRYTNNTAVLLSEKEFAYIMDKNKSIDIDTYEDFKLTEFLNQEV